MPPVCNYDAPAGPEELPTELGHVHCCMSGEDALDGFRHLCNITESLGFLPQTISMAQAAASSSPIRQARQAVPAFYFSVAMGRNYTVGSKLHGG
jgi:hypothetical protein